MRGLTIYVNHVLEGEPYFLNRLTLSVLLENLEVKGYCMKLET